MYCTPLEGVEGVQTGDLCIQGFEFGEGSMANSICKRARAGIVNDADTQCRIAPRASRPGEGSTGIANDADTPCRIAPGASRPGQGGRPGIGPAGTAPGGGAG
eukprot:SAG22_NODE_380_length_11402_cov_8.514154_1_plen_102_part_10